MTPLKEEAIIFEGPCGKIEGRLGNGDRDGTGVLLVLHPHPQYGGAMSNNVVKAVIGAAQRCGLVTLRINFRGVGRSEGGFGGGGELDDVQAALDFLRRKTGRSSTVLLAGYSFGACIALTYCHGPNHGVDHLFLIAPVPFLLQKNLSMELPVARKIVSGETDQIVSLEAVRAMVSKEHRDALIDVILGADHFFPIRKGRLKRSSRSFSGQSSKS